MESKEKEISVLLQVKGQISSTSENPAWKCVLGEGRDLWALSQPWKPLEVDGWYLQQAIADKMQKLKDKFGQLWILALGIPGDNCNGKL